MGRPDYVREVSAKARLGRPDYVCKVSIKARLLELSGNSTTLDFDFVYMNCKSVLRHEKKAYCDGEPDKVNPCFIIRERLVHMSVRCTGRKK